MLVFKKLISHHQYASTGLVHVSDISYGVGCFSSMLYWHRDLAHEELEQQASLEHVHGVRVKVYATCNLQAALVFAFHF